MELKLIERAAQELSYVLDQGGPEGGQTLTEEAAGNLAAIMLEEEDYRITLDVALNEAMQAARAALADADVCERYGLTRGEA